MMIILTGKLLIHIRLTRLADSYGGARGGGGAGVGCRYDDHVNW